jgi:L-iditol 2-dehydrogenase
VFVIPKTMRAVVYRGVNDLRLETVPVPRIGPNELLVKVAVCGVCPTDIKKIQHGTIPPPRIFGHETAGTIVKIGSQKAEGRSQKAKSAGGASVPASRFKIGDRVALHHHVPCLDCHFCRHASFAQCETYKRTGITAGFEPAGGGYAEYVRVMPFVLPGVVKIPTKNTFAEGAMLEPVNTVLKAVRRLNLLPGDTVLVSGQGPIGLMFTRLLHLAGARVLATDLLESRLKLAKKFGAKWTHLVDSRESNVEGRKASTLVSRPSSLDAAVIAVPSDAAVHEALQLVRGGGQVLLFAHTRRTEVRSQRPDSGSQKLPSPAGAGEGACKAVEGPGDENKSGSRKSDVRPTTSDLRLLSSDLCPLDFSSICLDEKDLIGSYSSDFTLQAEVARLVFSRRLDVRPLVSHYFPLEQTAAAVALAARPTADSLKILVRV